jgi:hypothetical protein
VKQAIPMPPFLPDQSAVSGALSVCENAYAKVDGYSPISGFTGFSSALPAAFKGGASFIAADGTSTLLVGTATGLEKFAGGSWTNLVGSMTVTGQWRFSQFGNFAIGVNGVSTKVVDLTAGTASTLTGAPAGVAIGVVGDYVVIIQDASELLNVYTSGFNDHTDWAVPGAGGATVQPMLTGGECMGFAGGEYGVILQRQRIVRMTRTGDADAPFQYDEITPNVGCASKASVMSVGRTVFFLSDSGFKALEDGQQIRPIGSEKIDRTFQAEVPRDDYERLFVAHDPQSKIVAWCVPGSPGKIWIYNYELDRWSTAKLPLDGIFSGFTSSVSLETLAVTYPDLDAMTISLDDPRWAGGNPRLYCVQSGAVGTFFGDSLAATFEFGFIEPAQGRRTRFQAVRLVTDAVSGLTLKMDCRARLGDDPDVTTVTDLRGSGVMPIRAAGRYAKPRIEYAAGADWSYLNSVEIEYEAGGVR